jgi:AraC-like DNA-binding protein
LIIDSNLADIVKQVFWFPYSYLLAIGPLLFFYTKSLTDPDFRIGKKNLVYFVPVIIEVLIQLFFIKESITTNTLFYEVRGFVAFRIVEFAATVISILVFGRRSLAMIKIHEAWMLENFSNQKDVTLLWLSKLIKYLSVLLISGLIFELSFILYLQLRPDLIAVYLLLYLLLGVITYSNYWIAIQALIKSEVLTEKKVVASPTENSSVYSRLNEGEVNDYVEALGQVMLKEKLYLHETLSLRTLAARLQIDPNLLSYVLNNVFEKSFYDYVNEFRIDEVKRKIADPAYAHLKIVEVAYECGFNSKASFNRVFKKHTGKSPSEYRKLPVTAQ